MNKSPAKADLGGNQTPFVAPEPVELNINFTGTITDLSRDIHQFNVDKGWWDEWLDDKSRRFKTARMLIVSELSEAMEGCRKDLMDDKLPQYKMFHVEIIDALIRLLDLAGALNVPLRDLPLGRSFNHLSTHDTIPDQLDTCVRWVYVTGYNYAEIIRNGVAAMIAMCEIHKIKMSEVMKAKMQFNAIRADHKKENRAKTNGKQF